MYAVVRTGGKQLRVEPGDIVEVEHISASPGDRVELSEILLLGGDTVRIGTPTIEGARVVATVEPPSKGPKIRIFHVRRRKRYRLRKGHRQGYTRLRVDSIEA